MTTDPTAVIFAALEGLQGTAHHLPPGTRQAVAEHLARALPAVAPVPPPADRATPAAMWIDGHPQLEAIAAAVWERCEHHDSGLIIDDPRNIAVAALAAVLAVLPEQTDQATLLREAALNEAAAAIQDVIDADRAKFPRRSNDRAALGAARQIVLGLIDNPRRLAAEQPTETQDGGPTVGEVQHMLARMRATAAENRLAEALRIVSNWHRSSEGGDALVEDLAVVGLRLPHSCRNCEGVGPDTCLMNPDRPKPPPMDPVHILGIGADDAERPAVGERPDTQTPEAVVVGCSSWSFRRDHAPHDWEPQPGLTVHCPGHAPPLTEPVP